MENLGMPCGSKPDKDMMEEAGVMVGIDLKKDINVSEMTVQEVYSMVSYDDPTHVHVDRTAILYSVVFNEKGEREELTITFNLKSQRQPHPKAR